MVAKVKTFSFVGIDVVDVDVQVKISPGLPGITIVGLPDKAVEESKESRDEEEKESPEDLKKQL